MIEAVLGFLSPWAIAIVVVALHLLLPATSVKGYVVDEDTGNPLKYRLNGVMVLCGVVALWLLLGYLDVVPLEWLWQQRWSAASGACVLGLLATAACVLKGSRWHKSLLAEWWLGRLVNPQLLGKRIDVKMVLYLYGAVMLELNLLAFAMHHVTFFEEGPSLGILLYVLMFSWFLVDYLFFEKVHLYTYDFVAERVGFKLTWGCIAFYPYFYPIGLWTVAALPDPGVSPVVLCMSLGMFLLGWVLSRGANLQKYHFKVAPHRRFVGWLKPHAITDGERRILCSGFWGLSRHINYLGELLMALGLTLSLGYPWLILPWLYPLYYVVLLGTRERDDDRRCSEKYGELWEQYRQEVPWRIIPRIY